MNPKSTHVLPAESVGPNSFIHAVPNREGRRYRILVVDDDSSIRDIYFEVLTMNGYQVDLAEDGAVAWDILQQGNYDLLVTDNRMPKVTGMELLGRLEAARSKLPVILATSSLPMETEDHRLSRKPSAALVKPFTNDQLLETVSRVLGRQSWVPPRHDRDPEGEGFHLNLIR